MKPFITQQGLSHGLWGFTAGLQFNSRMDPCLPWFSHQSEPYGGGLKNSNKC